MGDELVELKTTTVQAPVEERTGPPRSVRVLTGLLAIGGALVLGLRISDLRHWTLQDVPTMLGLTLAVALAERFSIRLRLRTEHLNFSLTEAVAVAALILARASVLTLAVGLGVLLAQMAKRNRVLKVAFNVGQFVMALTVAQLVYRAFDPGELLGPKMLLATGVAMAAYAIVNAGLVAVVIALVERRRVLEIALPPLPTNAFHFGGNTAVGVAGAAVWVATPLGVPVYALLLALAYVAYSALVGSVAARLPAS